VLSVSASDPLCRFIIPEVIHINPVSDGWHHVLPEIIYPAHSLLLLFRCIPATKKQEIERRFAVGECRRVRRNPRRLPMNELQAKSTASHGLVCPKIRHGVQRTVPQIVQKRGSPVMLLSGFCPPVHHFLKFRIWHYLELIHQGLPE